GGKPKNGVRTNYAKPAAGFPLIALTPLSVFHAELLADGAQVVAVRLEGVARDVGGRRVAVGAVAGGDVVGELARTAGRAERHAFPDDFIQLGFGKTKVHHSPLAIELHLLDAHALVIDEIAGELHAAPLLPRGR